MIMTDPVNNNLPDDAQTEATATLKIDTIYQQLKDGSDFATVARKRSEDTNSNTKGGDIGFATEKDLKDNGFSENLVRQFFGSMSVGDITAPVRFRSGRWYIFLLTQRNLQDESLTLESPGVREQIAKALVDQRKQISNAELLATVLNEAKIVNYLATGKPPDPK